jgi:hypothetical protein
MNLSFSRKEASKRKRRKKYIRAKKGIDTI